MITLGPKFTTYGTVTFFDFGDKKYALKFFEIEKIPDMVDYEKFFDLIRKSTANLSFSVLKKNDSVSAFFSVGCFASSKFEMRSSLYIESERMRGILSSLGIEYKEVSDLGKINDMIDVISSFVSDRTSVDAVILEGIPKTGGRQLDDVVKFFLNSDSDFQFTVLASPVPERSVDHNLEIIRKNRMRFMKTFKELPELRRQIEEHRMRLEEAKKSGYWRVLPVIILKKHKGVILESASVGEFLKTVFSSGSSLKYSRVRIDDIALPLMIRSPHNFQRVSMLNSKELSAYMSIPALIQKKKQLSLEPPPESACRGEYFMGKTFYNGKELCDFYLRESEMFKHVLITGMPGSGKTNLAFLLIDGFLRSGKPFMVFDWKRSYRNLLTLSDNIMVFTVGRRVAPFYWNPLVPPRGTPPDVWLAKLVEIIGHSFLLGYGASSIFRKAINECYEKAGIYEGSKDFPDMFDVMRSIENHRPKTSSWRERGWFDSAKRSVELLTFRNIGEVFSKRKSFPLEKLLDKNVIFELDFLQEDSKIFFIESMFLWIYHYRMAEQEKEVFKHATIIEEAHHVISKDKERKDGKETIIDVMLREIREFGEGIILIDQMPSKISSSALSNTYATVCFNVKSGNDIAEISRIMGFSGEERNQLSRLRVGESVVKLQGRHTMPFLLKTPYIDVKKGAVTDEIVRERMGTFYDEIKSFMKDKGRSRKTGDFLKTNKIKKIGVKFAEQALLKHDFSWEFSESMLSPNEKSLLLNIIDEPLKGISSRYKSLGLNAYQGNKARRSLMEKGMVRSTVVPREKGKGYIKILEPTAKAMRLLGKTKSFRTWRKGTVRHRYWIDRLAKSYAEKNYNARTEEPAGGGKSVDLVVSKNGKRTAIEVATGFSDEYYNALKDLEAGFDEVIVACISREALSMVRKQFSGTEMENDKRVKIIFINELLERLKTVGE